MAKPLENNERYEFGPFRVDVAEHSVFRENQTIPLTPKAFDVLLVLIRSHSRVVAKEELLRAVWPETFVEEGILAVNVSTLRRALGEASDGRAYIETVPKRGYRFVGHVKESTPTQRQVRRGPWTLGFALAAVAGVSAAWFLVRPHSETRMPMQPVPLTSYPGSEHNPTFSPGGDQVAFSWNGEKEDNFDIYVKSVGASGIPLRLTRDPAPDRFPAWSPDGRYIAFERAGSVYLVPPLGGPERKLADFNAGHIAWTPDGKSVAVSAWRQGIYLISLESGEKRQITFPPADTMGDLFFAFSPDGGDLVIARFVTSVSADLFLMPVPSDGMRGELKKLLAVGAHVYGLTWTPDGRDVIYASSAPMLSPGLWRLPVKPPSDLPPQRIAGVEEGATEPALSHPTSRGATRLAYSRTEFDTNIWLRNGQSGTPVRLIASTRMDTNPQFSPDGRTIVFASNRSGQFELWLCSADGTNPVQLTSLKPTFLNAPRWSPDGKSVAFSAFIEGNRDIYVISAEGGGLRRLTSEPSEEGRPNWSRDGRWIYFYSNRSGKQQIFKAPAQGGPAVQVTFGGGHESFESADGKTLYYNNYEGSEVRGRGLWSRPAAAEPNIKLERAVPELATVTQSYWTVIDRGIVFVEFEDAILDSARRNRMDDAMPKGPADAYNASLPGAANRIKFFDFASRRVSEIGTIDGTVVRTNPGFSVTHDGRSTVWAQIDRYESDLMLVENFR